MKSNSIPCKDCVVFAICNSKIREFVKHNDYYGAGFILISDCILFRQYFNDTSVPISIIMESVADVF